MKVLKALGIFLAAIILSAALLCAYVLWDNARVKVSEYTIESASLPAAFDGYTIAFVSDYHDRPDYEAVASKVKSVSPDVIILGGDAVNMATEDFTNLKGLCSALAEICDVYYAYGNHEIWSMKDTKIAAGDAARDCGVTVLNDAVVRLERGGASIALAGYRDLQYADKSMDIQLYRAEDKLKKLKEKCAEDFSVLLFHRANYFDTVAPYGFDVVLSGHTHGGYVNLPRVRDYILNEHIGSTKYVRGRYEAENSTMIVSAGLGQDGTFPRVFDTPEIVKVVLKR